MASPVFKKRFARRKTTHRPFTFARNFETDGASSPTQNQVVSQVGDRGLVITSPVQLSNSKEGLTISDIVRKSSVPVLIAHSPPNDKPKESPEHEEEEEEADTSQHRRSFRSREPSEQFLNRRQYPHGTSQIVKVHRTPDEHYIGSRNNSNIDAEVSFTDDGGQTRRGKKSAAASSSKSSKQRARLQKSKDLDVSSTGKTQNHDTLQHEDSRSSVWGTSAKKGSARKETTASARTSSSKRSRGQPALNRTPTPLPSVQEDAISSSDETKKSSAKNKTSVSSFFKRSKNENALLSSAKSKESEVKNKTPPSSVSKRNKAANVSLSSAKSKRSPAKNKTPPPSLSKSKKARTRDLRSADKTLSQGSKSMSFSQENQDTMLPSGDEDLTSWVNKSRLLPQQNKDEAHPVGDKVKTISYENKETTSPSPSVRSKETKPAESLPTAGKRNHSFTSRSSRKGSSQSELDTSAKSASRRDNTSLVSESTQKRRGSIAETSLHLNKSTRLSPIQETERSKPNKIDKNGDTFGSGVRGKIVKDSEPVVSSAPRRRKMSSNDSSNDKTLGPSPEKRARNFRLRRTETSMTQNQSVRRESYMSGLSDSRSRREKSSLLETSNSQSAQRNKKKLPQPDNHKENVSLFNNRDSQAGLKVRPSTSGAKVRRKREWSEQPNTSFSGPRKSPRKLSETVKMNLSPKKKTSKSSNSFWNTSRRIDSSLRPRRQQRATSESFVYDDNFRAEEMDSAATSRRNVRKGASHTRLDQGKSKCHGSSCLDQGKSDTSSEEVEEKKRRPVVTELGVIVNMLEDTEMEIMEDSVMSQPCQKMVHQAFTFTNKQLQETESQLNQIAELTYQIKKLKSVCKDMSSESKENLHQKFILQKELQSLKSRGIDADMMRIDHWLQDFQALQQCTR